jgi:hypothetical protein
MEMGRRSWVRWLRPLCASMLLGLAVSLGTPPGAPAAGADGPASLDELLAKAAQQGTLRVIVEVRTGAPGVPTPEAIARAQDLVLQELAGTGHRVLRRYATVPLLSLEVTSDALRRLGGSARVARIREDRLRTPR